MKHGVLAVVGDAALVQAYSMSHLGPNDSQSNIARNNPTHKQLLATIMYRRQETKTLCTQKQLLLTPEGVSDSDVDGSPADLLELPPSLVNSSAAVLATEFD